jgi:hypothetical protein
MVFKTWLVFIFFILTQYYSSAQVAHNHRWRALFSAGVNFASDGGFIEDVAANSPNLPTINIGIQHMLKRNYGVRLDYSFSRFKNADNSPDFKINYSRINIQFVYDVTQSLISSNTISILAHAGPGYSFANPLGGLDDNKQSYLNLMGGLELGYPVSRKVTLIGDVSYIYGATSLDDFNSITNGLGAFNGNVVTATLGISLALSGCATCN